MSRNVSSIVNLFAVELDDVARLAIRKRGGQTPRLLHLRRVNKDDGWNLRAVVRDAHIAQHRGAAARGHPGVGGPRFPDRVLDDDTPAEADDEVPADELQKVVELAIAEAPVGEQNDLNRLVNGAVKPLDELVFVVLLGTLQRGLLYGLPCQRRRTAMPCHKVGAERRVVVLLEVRPVQRDNDLFADPDHELYPRPQGMEHVDAGIAQQPVDLLDPALRLDVGDLRIRLADGIGWPAPPPAGRQRRRSRATGRASRAGHRRTNSRRRSGCTSGRLSGGWSA